MTATVLTVVALIAGMNVFGGPVDVFGMYALALLINIAGLLWACGVAMRFRTMQAGPVMQMPVFLTLFFAPVYVPLGLLDGWIEAIATVNPLTYVLEAVRSMLAGDEIHVALAFGIAVGADRGLLALGAARAALGGGGGLGSGPRACPLRRQRSSGASASQPGRARFRVWAPQRALRRRASRTSDHALTDTGDGFWAGEVAAKPGDDYRFVLDGGDAWPDPCSRWQPEGVRGPSRVLDTSAFEIAPGPELALDELVLYELHVGTFSRRGNVRRRRPAPCRACASSASPRSS